MTIFPNYNFPVNDDWIFYRQVEAFLLGKYTISESIDPSFILQGVLGAIWSKLVGLSFANLWVLTIVVTLLGAVGLYQLLKFFDVAKKTRVIAILLYTLNPIIITSAFSFMSENYYLTFFIWGIYFFCAYFKSRKLTYLTAAAVVCGLTILIRQVGIVLMIAFAITYLVKNKKPDFVTLVTVSLPVLIALIIWLMWPHYGDKGVFEALIEPKQLPYRLVLMLGSPIYFAYFLSPLIFGIFSYAKNKYLGILTAVFLPIIYMLDLFPIGSVFYIEGLMLKSNFSHDLSLFDAILTKLAIGAFIAFSLSVVLFNLVKLAIAKIKVQLDEYTLFILLTFLGSVGVLLLINDFYERYLIPATFSLLLLGVISSKVKVTKIGILGFVILGTLTYVNQLEYLSVNSLMWKQAYKLQQLTGHTTSIYASDVYTKYTYAQEQNDYTGMLDSKPGGLEYKCYVQEYTLESDNILFKLADTTEEVLGGIVKNPRIYDSRKPQVKRIKKNMDKLIDNEEYFSPKFNLVGKRAFVGSWCDIDEN